MSEYILLIIFVIGVILIIFVENLLKNKENEIEIVLNEIENLKNTPKPQKTYECRYCNSICDEKDVHLEKGRLVCNFCGDYIYEVP